MSAKFIKGILITVLSLAVLLGAYLAYSRYFVEVQSRTVELCVDLKDIKKIAAMDKKPLHLLLEEVKNLGFTSIGVFEQTLPEASSQGDLFYMVGSGILTTALANTPFDNLKEKGLIKPSRTYISIPDNIIRKRVYNHLKSSLGKGMIKFLGRDIFEINETATELGSLGLGISENDHNYFTNLGFSIIPRVWNDPRYDINKKILYLSRFNTIIFDGEEILGYPDKIEQTAKALLNYKVNYGHVEIITQYGNNRLKKLTERNIVRVHSVSQKELKKLEMNVVVKRFVRAARERGVRLLYVRPFLSSASAEQNMDYFSRIKNSLAQAGFVFGQAEKPTDFKVSPRQIKFLGLGVLVGLIFLLNYFIDLSLLPTIILFAVGALAVNTAGAGAHTQKILALLAAITFPSMAVISTFAKKPKIIFSYLDPILIILNILGETMIGVFLVLGLLADYRFMIGAQTFTGVKIALLAPMAIIAAYFILKNGDKSVQEKFKGLINTRINLGAALSCLFALLCLVILLARSGNFIIPVADLERGLRGWLEGVMLIRPRTKEFLIGYPFLFVAAIAYLRGQTKWLWALAAIGAIAPISVFNSFCHTHTPIMISMGRTINGLLPGVTFGLIIGFLFDKFLFNPKS